MDNKEPDIKYFLYARKSSENEDRQIQSIDDQINRLKEFAKNFDLHIVKIFEESKSAKNPGDRPVFEDMMNRIENNEAQGILCWRLNRLTRNPIDTGRLSWLLQSSIIKSIKTTERNYLPGDNVLLFSVDGGMANQFVLDLSKDVKRGLINKLKQGWLPNRAPIGYLNDRENKIITIDPERFDLVRKIWDLMLTGNYTPPKILKIVNEEWGLRTRKLKRSGGKKVSRGGLYKIFSNPFFKGVIVNHGIKYEGKHKPMVTSEEYNRVQELLGRNVKQKIKRHSFAYTGFIKCAECGCLYTAEVKTKLIKKTNKIKSYIYYHCTRKKKDIICTQRNSIREDRLEVQIDKKLKEYTIIPEFRDWALEVLREEQKKEVTDREKIQKTKQKTYKYIQENINRLIDMKLNDQITDKEYNIKRNSLIEDKVKIKEELDQIDSRADRWLELTEKAFNFITNLREVFLKSNIRLKKDILMALGKNITVKDGNLSIESNEWLIPIKEKYSVLEESFLRLEPAENLYNNRENEALLPVRSQWHSVRS